MHLKTLLILILTACPLVSVAQQPGGFWSHGVGKILRSVDEMMVARERRGFDSLYVQVPERDCYFFVGSNIAAQYYDLYFPILLEPAQYPSFVQLYLPSNVSELMYVEPKFRATKAGMNFGINWRGLSMQLPIPLDSNFSKTFSLSSNGNRFGFSINYRTMNNISGPIMDPFIQLEEHMISNILYDVKNYQKVLEHHEPLEAKERQIPDGSLDFTTFSADAYYVFNYRKFCMAAGTTGNKLQIRSAMTPLVMASYFASSLGTNMLNNERDVFRNQIFSAGVGLAYNLSLMHGRLCIQMTSVPMVSLYNNLEHDSTPYVRTETYSEEVEKVLSTFEEYQHHYYDAVDQGGKSKLKLGIRARISAIYHFDRYMLSLLINSRSNHFGNTSGCTMKDQEFDFRLRLGYRF